MKNNLRRCQSCVTCKYRIARYCNLDGGYVDMFYMTDMVHSDAINTKSHQRNWRKRNEIGDYMVCDDWESDE